MIRRLEEQFDPATVRSLQLLIGRIRALDLPEGSSRYYALELAHCLEAGALLGGLHVAASLLELVVRGIVVERSAQASQQPIDLEQRLEEMRHLGFANLVDHLVDAGLFRQDDGVTAKGFYNSVRIPIHHGLAGRFVTGHDEVKAMMKPFIGFSMPTTAHDVEEVIEDCAIPQIDTVVGIIERNST